MSHLTQVSEPVDGSTVLIVDDDPTNNLILSGLLHARGYKTRSAADGFQALRMMQDDRYWAIFMDIQMPGIDGFETIRRMRELDLPHKPASAKVVGVSASVEKSVLARAEGFDAFLSKPIFGQDLSAVLNNLANFDAVNAATHG